MQLSEWKTNTYGGLLATRSTFLKAVDAALLAYEDPKSDKGVALVQAILDAVAVWQDKNDKFEWIVHGANLKTWAEGRKIVAENGELAREAFKAARDHYKHGPKSTNKMIFEFEVGDKRRTPGNILAAQISGARRAQASAIFVQENRGTVNFTAQNAQNLVQLKAGNCNEQAKFARDFVLGKNAQAAVSLFELSWTATDTNLGGYSKVNAPDHVFCVVGETNTPVNNTLPADMRNWPESLWVVDPWATLCCPAVDYPVAFMTKAKEWSNKNLRIGYIQSGATANDQPRSVWGDPSDVAYLNALIFNEKRRQL
ncbi:MAG TPA: hypothetical protein VH414_13505 [Lichenihabitans sp.]|jgi:hypothetical protein|nr:hypothetical protein [Lichenihabitans sp.]